MSDDFYIKLSETAAGLLLRFGKTITIVRYEGRFNDPVTGVLTEGTRTEIATTGVVINYEDKDIDGVRIIEGDRLVVVDNSEIVSPSDRIVFDGEEWRVIDNKQAKPANINIVSFIQVRK